MRFFVLAVALSILLFGCASQTQAPQGNSMNLTGGSAASFQQQNGLQDNSSTTALAPVIGTPAPLPEPAPIYNYSLTRTSDGKLIVYYFYSSYECPTCDDSRPLTERLKSEYGNATEWREIDLQNGSQSPVYWSFVGYRNLTACLQKVPAAFFNNTLLVGYALENSLEKSINESISPENAARP